MAKEKATDMLYKDKERGACGSSLFVWGGIYVWGYVGGSYVGGKSLYGALSM